MTLDSTITISVVLAIVALFSPIITSLINNYHLKSMRKLEFEELSKQKLLEQKQRQALELLLF